MDILHNYEGRYEHSSNLWKRDVATHLVSIDEKCVSCGLCIHECPHTSIRLFCISKDVYDTEYPDKYKRSIDKNIKDNYKILAYSPKDCTGCGECVKSCNTKNLSLLPRADIDLELEQERFDWLYNYSYNNVYSSNNYADLACSTPFFEFSGACAGCGETKYLGMLSRIYQDNLVVVNATGCSSIYGGTVPFLPWKCSWISSLFEDSAEVGLGIALSNTSKSIWVVMGDGAAYDIGYSGLDHIMSQSNVNINVLVLNNGQYSNTGGQASKATPIGEKHGLQSGGKLTENKNLIQALKGAYGDSIYTAEISIKNKVDCYNKIKEAGIFNGPSIVIADCYCIMNKYHRSKNEGN